MTGLEVLAGLFKTATDAAVLVSSTLVAANELKELIDQNDGAPLTPEQLEPFTARRKAAEEAWENRRK